MDGQRGSRRLMLGALVVMLAAATALGDGSGASAEVKKRPDYGSKAQFKLECELMGGTFKEDDLGNTECHWPNGSRIECDSNGNDCWYTPAALPAQPTGPWDSHVGTVREATADVGDSVDQGVPGDHTPTDDVTAAGNASAPVGSASVAIAAGDQEPDNAKSKGKHGKGKKRGHRGKGHKR
jgi:hypothetical protein